MKESKKPEGRAKNRRMEAAVLEFFSDWQAAFAASFLLLLQLFHVYHYLLMYPQLLVTFSFHFS